MINKKSIELKFEMDGKKENDTKCSKLRVDQR